VAIGEGDDGSGDFDDIRDRDLSLKFWNIGRGCENNSQKP